MYRTKLLKDFQKLSPAGKKDLVGFCEENTYACVWMKDELLKLAEFLIAQKTFTPKSVEQKRVFKYIYGKEDFDSGKFENLMSCFHEAMYMARILNQPKK